MEAWQIIGVIWLGFIVIGLLLLPLQFGIPASEDRSRRQKGEPAPKDRSRRQKGEPDQPTSRFDVIELNGGEDNWK